MKFDLKTRAKNPYFWLGLGGVVLTALNVSPEMFTSWGSVWVQVKELISNPYLLGTTIIAILGVLGDHTTKGLCDCKKQGDSK